MFIGDFKEKCGVGGGGGGGGGGGEEGNIFIFS